MFFSAGISDSCLLPSTPSSFVNVNNYALLRKDVVGNVPKHGACMYVRASYNYNEVNVQAPNVVAVHLPDHDCILLQYTSHLLTPLWMMST